MTETFPPAPQGKARIIVRTYGGTVLVDTLVDERSTSVINLPDNQTLESMSMKSVEP